MRLKAQIYKADVPNVNGVVYTKEALKNAAADWNVELDKFVVYEPYGSSGGQIDMAKVVGTCKVVMEGDNCIAEVTLLPYPHTAEIQERIHQELTPLMCLPSSTVSINDNVVDKMSITHITIASTWVDVGDNPHNLFEMKPDE